MNGDRVLVEAVSGAAVLGWSSDAQGRIDAASRRRHRAAGNRDSLARATTRVSLGGNLNTDANVGAATTVARVYDSQGREHQLQVTFTKSGDNAWSWAADDEAGPPSAAAPWSSTAAGSVPPGGGAQRP